MNGVGHVHRCTCCGRPYTCDLPECHGLVYFGACVGCGGTLRITEQTTMPLPVPRHDYLSTGRTTTALIASGGARV